MTINKLIKNSFKNNNKTIQNIQNYKRQLIRSYKTQQDCLLLVNCQKIPCSSLTFHSQCSAIGVNCSVFRIFLANCSGSEHRSRRHSIGGDRSVRERAGQVMIRRSEPISISAISGSLLTILAPKTCRQKRAAVVTSDGATTSSGVSSIEQKRS